MVSGSMAGALVTRAVRQPETEVPVEAWILIGVVLGLIVFDILALRFGTDSRSEWYNPHDWS